MKGSDLCPNCNQRVLSPWDSLMLSRRCTLCGHQEDKPQGWNEPASKDAVYVPEPSRPKIP